MSNQLLPCPFCGHDEPTHDEGDESAWIQCTNAECGMCGPITSGPALAAAAWNRRATQPAAGEPEQQTAINADDLPTKKYPLAAFDFDAPVAAGEPVALSEEAMSTIVGMVELCLERRYCMGMDEGFKSFEPEVEHDFVKELRAFVDGAGKFRAAPPAAAHGDEAVRKLVLPTPEQVMNVVMKFQWEDRKNGTGTTNWAANLGMTVVEYVARLNADAASGPSISMTDAEHWTEREIAEFLSIALRHVTVKGSLDPQDMRDAFRVMREQAAMRAQAGEGGA